MVEKRDLSDFIQPEFPTEIGDAGAVTFRRDGREYRLSREREGLWVIDEVGDPESDFRLEISNVTALYIDVAGRGHSGPMQSFATTRTELFTKLF